MEGYSEGYENWYFKYLGIYSLCDAGEENIVWDGRWVELAQISDRWLDLLFVLNLWVLLQKIVNVVPPVKFNAL
jgi:hypothetical protein